MIHIYLLYISIKSNFKFTIKFVGLSVGLINPIVNLKIK